MGLSRRRETCLTVRMQLDDDDFEQDEGSAPMNREQRRQMKKLGKKGKPTKMAREEMMDAASAQIASSPASTDTEEAPSRGALALEEMRQAALRSKEERVRKAGQQRQASLPGTEELRRVDPKVLFAAERTLLNGVLVSGGIWVFCGLCVAVDAYLIATKQQVPQALDSALSKYIEPYLTPGLVLVLAFSALLGLMQVYKFEGVKADTKLKQASQVKRKVQTGATKFLK